MIIDVEPIHQGINEIWEKFKKEFEEAEEIIEGDDESSTNFK